MILAIDSSTARSGVGLYDENTGEVVEERNWRTGTDHCRQLMPAVDALIGSHRLTPSDVGAIAVARGPGTFNGVRVGVATAKALAASIGCPLVGIGTLEVYAAAFRGSGLLVRPVLDAARGEICTGLWRAGDRLEAIEPPHLAAPGDSLAVAGERLLVVGEIPAEWRLVLASLPGVALGGPGTELRRPGALAALAAERLRAGDTDDETTMEPVYLRQPHITARRR